MELVGESEDPGIRDVVGEIILVEEEDVYLLALYPHQPHGLVCYAAHRHTVQRLQQVLQ